MRALRFKRRGYITTGLFSCLMLSLGCTHTPRHTSSSSSLANNQVSLTHSSQSATLRDPALTMGVLPNGLRYYIRANPYPAKRALLWLAVNAGSLQEDDDQLGFAHFLEHMAFNGTRHFPGQSLIDFIERSGMTFGGDLNASTSFEETIYKLTVPTDDRAIFAEGMQVIDDWANGRILSDSVEVAAERGVVLGEWRVRLPDTMSQRYQRDQIARIYGENSLFVKRFPIGDPELLKTATPGPIMRYYRDWYRPDLMAVVAVGDFDPREVEKEIKKRFSSVPVPKNPRQFERPVVDHPAGTVVNTIRERIAPMVNLTWPAAPMSDNPELAIRQSLIEQLTVPYLNRKLTALSKQERRLFAGAGVGRMRGVTRLSPERMVLRVFTTADSVMRSFKAALTELERVAQHGISDDVLANEKQSLLRRYQAQADGSEAISSGVYVQSYVSHFLTERGQLLGARQQLELATRILPTITSEDIAKNLQGWRAEDGRIVDVAQHAYAAVAVIKEDEVRELLREVAMEKLAATPATGSLSAASTTSKGGMPSLIRSALPAPGTVVSTEQFAASGVTLWTMSNGARVVYKQNPSLPDDFIIKAHSLGGHSLLHDSIFATPARLVGMLMTSSGGLDGIDHDALIQQARTTGLRAFQVALNAFDEQIVVGGSPRETEYMFQLLHLQFTAPTIDTLALDDWRRNGRRSLMMHRNDQIAFQASGGHRRFAPPSPAQVPFIDLKQARMVYDDRFGDASDFTFYIAGPSSAADILPFVTQYIATLPSANRAEREIPKDFKIPPYIKRKAEAKLKLPHVPPEKSAMSLAFAGSIPKDTTEFLLATYELSSASWILGRRLRNALREEMGVTYSAGASYSQYWTPDPRYLVSTNVITDPEMLDTTVARVLAIVDELRKDGPTDEELAMYKKIRERQTETAQQRNDWWVNRLEMLDRIGVSYDYLEQSGFLQSLTREQVRAAAQRYFPEKRYVLQSVKPTKKNEPEDQDKEEDKDKESEKGDKLDPLE